LFSCEFLREPEVANHSWEGDRAEERVRLNDEDTKSIPDLIKMEFRFASSQNARRPCDIAKLRYSVD